MATWRGELITFTYCGFQWLQAIYTSRMRVLTYMHRSVLKFAGEKEKLLL